MTHLFKRSSQCPFWVSLKVVFCMEACRNLCPRWVSCRSMSSARGLPDLGMVQFMELLKDHERLGVPRDAGTDSDKGFDLGRMRRLVCSLGDPVSTYPVVHIAGTKGKGSTVAFLSNILRAAGYSVGSYTSPHVRSIRERIAVGSPISEKALENLFQSVREPLLEAIAAENWRLTHFEVFTALAFKYFAQEKVDLAVVEAGLGGARDATNIIPPEGLAAAVIVSIGEEHLEALGGSLESIALAKAGIIKKARPLVLSRQRSSVAEGIVHARAILNCAPVIQAYGSHVQGVIKKFENGRDGLFQICDFVINSGFVLQHGKCLGKIFELRDCKLRMFGPHQVDNALTAICAALCLRAEGWQIPDFAFRMGLEETFVPGRFQVLSSEQSAMLGSDGAAMILDGAHTAESASALAVTLRSLFPSEPIIFITAMATDKDHLGFASSSLEIKPTAVLATKVNVAGSSARSASEETILNAWTQAASRNNLEVLRISEGQRAAENQSGVTMATSESVDSAIKLALKLLQQRKIGESQGVICITGSLHAVAAALELVSIQETC